MLNSHQFIKLSEAQIETQNRIEAKILTKHLLEKAIPMKVVGGFAKTS